MAADGRRPARLADIGSWPSLDEELESSHGYADPELFDDEDIRHRHIFYELVRGARDTARSRRETALVRSRLRFEFEQRRREKP